MNVREPAGPIQILAPGLINLLQLKVGGFTPDALRQDVQPTIDLEAWWLRATKRNLPGSWSTSLPAGTYTVIRSLADAGGTVLQVPARQWWYVHRCTLAVLVQVAAVTNGLGFGIAEPGGNRGAANNVSEFVLGEFLTGGAIGQTYLLTQEGLWLPPGTIIGAYIGTVGGGGTVDIYLSGLSYTPLDL